MSEATSMIFAGKIARRMKNNLPEGEAVVGPINVSDMESDRALFRMKDKQGRVFQITVSRYA